MVSKNNVQLKDRYATKQVPHYGIRKLSVGVASVLLSTTLYMGVTAHADTIAETDPQPTIDQPAGTTTGNVTGNVQLKSTSDQSASTTTNSISQKNDVSSKAVPTVLPEQPANATDVQPTAVTSGSQSTTNFNVESDNNGSAIKSVEQSTDPAALMTNFAVTEQPVDNTHNSDTTTLNSTFKWSIHYTDESGKNLLPDSVITHDYTRTDTGDQMGNWSYVPDSVKVTGTPNNGWHIDNPDFKFDQAAGGTTFDFATWYATAASIDGYTPNYGSVVLTDQLPKNPESLHAITTVDSGTHEFTFVYTQRPKTVTINYVNDDDNETVVKTDSVSGKASTEVTITPQLPKGYMLTPDKDVPSTYTVTDDANQAVTIHVQKQFVDLSDTDPQAKQTRTITLHYVYGAGDKQGQPAFDDAVLDVYYHRTATLDRATNQTTYGDWMWDQSQGDPSTPGYHVVSGKWTSLPQTWANVAADVPSIKGYYADLGQNDPTNINHIPSNTWVFPTYNNSLGGGISEGGKGATAYLDGYGYEVNPTHTIKYMPNKTTVTVNYVDDDNNKAVVGSQHWDGTIGQHIGLTLTPPDNYVLTPGWINPTSYDFDGVNSSWYTVHVKHKTQDVTDQQPKDQISKTETLTRKHLYGLGPHEGEKFGDPDIVEVPWHRTATKDLVTNKVSFGDWHVIWDEVKQLSGATKMWGDSEHNWVNGGLIAGHSGYSYLGVGAKAEAITTDGTVIGHGWYWMGEQDIENNHTIVQYYGREKVGVPVNYVNFDTNQQLTTRWLTGDNYLDGNTITLNKDDLTDWGKAVSNNYQLYAKQTLPTTYKIDTVSSNGNLTPITIYVVQPRTVQFTFADNDNTVNGQHPQVGDAVSVTGITGSTTSVNLTVPAGYKLVEGQQLPTTYTFAKGETKQVILLTHQHVTVQPDSPKTPSDKLPDNPDKSYPSGVAKDDLTKTVARKVTIVTPDGKQIVTNQTVTFTRNATVDEVTGNVTYGPWSENGKHEFATVDVPNVPGYTATGDVPSLTVTPDSKDTDVTIDYTANQQNTQIVFVDNDGKTVDTVDVNGKTGETVETNAKVPDKWKLVDNETVPSTITFSADTPEEVTVHIEHKIETKQLKIDTTVLFPRVIKDSYNPNYDNLGGYAPWISDDEFNSKEYWFGKYTDAGLVTGSVQYDLVSGKIVKVNNGETLKFGKTLFNYPSYEDIVNGGSIGDTAAYDGVKETFTDGLNEATHENLNYKVYASANLTKDAFTNKYLYGPSYNINNVLPFTFENGKQYGSDHEIDTSTINNSFSVNFNDLANVIDSYDIHNNDDGSLSAGSVLIMPIAYQPYISKTVTRTINIANPDGTVKTIKQTAEINQNVSVEFDWKVHHGETYLRKGDAYVTDNNWSTYEVPNIPGYTASQSQVNAVEVNGDTTDQTVNITYTANEHEISVEYVNNTTGQVVKTDHLSGKTGQTVSITPHVPDGWELVSGQSVPSEVTLGADGAPTTVIKVQPQERSVTVKFVDDQSFEQQVGQAVTLTGRNGDTTDLKLTVPDKYQLADGQQLPTSYTFTKGNGDVTIHLKHQVVQREATIDVRLGMYILVHVRSDDQDPESVVIPQTQWAQLDDKIKNDPRSAGRNLMPSVAVGALTGHVNYDLVNEEVVSLGNDWTSLNLGGKIYQMPDGTDVVNGVIIEFNNGTSEKFREEFLKYNPDTDPDYVNRPWHGYLSINATNNDDLFDAMRQLGLQAGLVGDDPNALAKATGDRAATGVKMTNKTIDLSWLQDTAHLGASDFSEQNGQLRAKTALVVAGVYVPYVEKTATRTINVTTPDGKTTAFKQTATLAKQIDFANDAHPAWTTGEWANYDAPIVPGYTASQPNVAKETVTGTTKDQTVNITYTANPQTTTVVYRTEDGTPVHTTTVNGETGQTVKVPNEVPTGWHIVNGEVPSELTFEPNGAPKTVVTIDHSHVTVTPDAPKTPADKLPDNPEKAYPAGVSETDLNKTVIRTIKVTTPDGQTKNIAQTAKLTRTADVDEVTGEVKYSDWTTGEWSSYDTPNVPGYTASQSNIAQQMVTSETEDQTVTVTYTANNQSTTVIYQYDGIPVHITTITGQTGQTVKVPNEVPAGWFVSYGEVPSEITFGPDGAPKMVINIDHSVLTVSPDTPKTPADTIPDNPTVHYPSGVSENDLNKTVTRTIKVTQPDGTTTDKVQTVKFGRGAMVDEVTGKIVMYSDWGTDSDSSTGQWDAYKVPTIAGYTATQTNVAAVTVDETTTDQTVEVSYTPNKQSTTVKYVDNQGEVIHTTTVDGVTNQTVKVPSEVPAGWTITKGKVPSEIIFGADGHEPIEVTVAHQHVTVTSDHPQTNGTKLPDNPAKTFNGVESNDLNKIITRTIKVTTPDGKATTTKQTVKLTRTADVDEVTGEVTYGKWTTGEWNAYEVPSLSGYTASQTIVEATPVDENTKDQTVEVSYTPNKQTTTIKYVDDKGQTIHTTTVDGVTDQTVKVPSEVPAGWMVTKGKVPSEITFGADGHEPVEVTISHRHVTVTPDHPQNNGTKLPDNPAKTFNGVETTDLNKTITRTINITTPDGQTKTVAQTAKLTRTADFDEVTGEVTYSKWTTGEWNTYEVPVLNGYTASQTSVEATLVDENTKDQTVEVNYTPNKQTTTIKYVDDKGQTIHTTTVNGLTDQTVKVPSEVPAGWMITKGKVPSEITFGADGHEPIKVTVAHQHVIVDPDHPQNNGTKLPDNPAKTFNGVEASDLNKTITRTIKVTTPDGKATTTKQTVKLTRTADVDEVTGEVTYSKWTTGQWNAYEVPALNGYTASQTSVEAAPVDENTKDRTVEVSYTPNKQSTTIKYVDDKGDVVHTTTVTGVTDQTVKVPDEVPAGWTITKGKVPSEITFGADGHEPVVITVAHQHVTVDPDHPQNNGTKLPDNPAKTFEGVEANDLNKIITRTIKVTTPDGQTKTVAQTAKLTRTADVDEVTGEVTYGKWTTGQWNAYEVPALNGYTASQTSVEATPVDENAKDQTVEVSYTPNSQSTTIKYVDDKGQTIHTTTVNGVTNQTVKVPSEVPAGWTITKGKVPSEITFGVDGHEPVVIAVGHQHVTVDPDHPQNNGTKLPDNPAKIFEGVEANDLNKTITRTIKFIIPDGKVTTTKQTAKLTRTANVDEVTGEVNYSDWTTGEWAAYDVPSVAGYAPSQAKVDNEPVTAASKDTTTTITYAPTQHQISVEYVDDDDRGKVVKTDQVPGKTDQVITVTPSAPTNYDLVDSNNRTYTVTSADGQRVQIHVKHHQVKTNESKTVTRTINVYTPHDGVKTVKQTATLNRDVTTDQVTGEKTYGNWTTGQWDAYTPGAIPGYTPSINEVPNTNVDGSSSDQTVNVTYTVDAQKVEIVYVDDAKGGAVVKTDQVAGKTDETVKVTPDVPAGYKVVGEVPGSYTLTANGHQTITVHLAHQTKTTSENKTVTRTINVHMPHDGVKTIKQTAMLTRTVTTDQVTGEKAYGDWSATLWDHYVVPAVAGYVPSIKQVAQQVVNGTTTDQMIDVTYSSGEHTTHINYVDGDGNIVHTTTIKGQTDGTAQVPNETPAGWTVVGERVPTELVFGPDGHADVTVTISHKHVTVTPDQLKTSSDKLPDNPAKTYPNGVGHDDLNKTITRTIKIMTPDSQTKTVEQTAKLTRTADVDEVTGEVTYGGWTTGEWSNYDVPSVSGYTPSQSEVPATKVTDTTKNQTVTIGYTANNQTTHVNYVDGNGKIVHTTTITGKTDQTVKVPNEVPAGWTITNGQVPTEITFGPDGHADVTVTVGHQHVTVTPDQPKTSSDKLPNNPGKTYPSGVGHDNLNKTITRTIKVTTPTGKTDTIKQTAKLTRTADVDEVTGEVTYGKWTTGAWSSYSAPTVSGYTPSQAVVAEAAVYADTTDQTVKITYTADSHTTHINYVDDNGKVVHTTTITGQTDQTVKVPNETPAGWMITTGQVPSEVIFGADGHADVTVSIDHQTVTVTPDHPQVDGTKLPDNPALTFHDVDHDDLNKTITRTIKLNVPGQDPQVITQTAHLTRTATVDEVTGEVTYGDWTNGQWDAYEVPAVDGYTASQTTIPAVNVISETTSQEIVIDYVAVPTAQMTPSNNQTDENQVTPEKVVKVATGTVQNTQQDAIKNPVQSTMQDTKQLPQTGNDNRAGLLSLIGSSLMASLAVFGLGKKKKHEN